MALRLIEIVVSDDRSDEIRRLVNERDVLGTWKESTVGGKSVIRAVVQAQDAEPIMDAVQQRFPVADSYRIILLPVEASLPRASEEESGRVLRLRHADGSKHRVSRAELYDEVSEGTRLTPVFLAMAVLSSIVAAVGLIRDNVAVLVGAMVIAPLLSPNVTLALATTLGDGKMAGRALRAKLSGVGIAAAISIATGLVLEVDPTLSSIATRTEVGISDFALALAAGSAGTLAFTSGLPGTVIGVMVAVALLPPLAASGLLVGSGHFRLALGAFLLALTNVICVNLAGVVTFFLQGVRPRTWWKAEQAKRATRRAIVAWTGLLVALLTVVYLAAKH